ncbi:MAG: arsenate reductase/protein-tyrosine-phosphatase family protein [Candidatus Hodarchaeales archaeon]|jgi:protein-tyrosine phosphatase
MSNSMKKTINKLKRKKTISINFVCSGNIIRSPYAELLFQKLLLEKNPKLSARIRVESSGVTYKNFSISRETTQMLIHEGVPRTRIDKFSPRYIGDYPKMYDKNDLILVMEENHLSAIPNQARNKAFLLLEFIYGQTKDVPDPFFTPPFETAYNMIKEALKILIEELVVNLSVDL